MAMRRHNAEPPRRSRRLRTLLDAHAESLSACRRCTFDDAAIRPVIASAREPVAMLIGQAPGKTEVIDRRPFAGRAGKTLFRWFGQVGIAESVARRRIYIAAITRCFPGPSPSGRGDRVPTPGQVSNCASWLDAELAMIRPPVVILVGRMGIERFLGTAPLAEQVGRAHILRDLPYAPVAIPLPHPSGASSWIHQRNHPELLDRALAALARELRAITVVAERSRSVA